MNDAQPGKVIGILSGMGPHAGLDLAEKILKQTQARTDQEHLPVAILSYPERIVDRSTYLFDETKPTPVPALTKIALQLAGVGAVVGGIPCNTAHDPRIFGAIERRLKAQSAPLRLIHMIDETAERIRRDLDGVERVGVLASTAVYEFGLYEASLERHDLVPVVPARDVQDELVNPVIFDTEFGIKAQSQPVTEQARRHLLDAAAHLKEHGAEAIILGCTEFPLALPEATAHDLPLVDPTVMLARALIRETAPEKLRPLSAALPV